MSSNPYAAPAADLVSAAAGKDGQFSPAMVQHLRETKPWVRFLAVLGFIGIGLMAVVGLGFGAMTSLASDDAFGAIGGLGMAAVYLVMAALYLLPTLRLNGFATAIEKVAAGGGTAAIEEALSEQRRFWRVVGIMMIVVMVLWGLAVVGGIVAGIVGATMAGSGN
jgi:hypothetical protein